MFLKADQFTDYQSNPGRKNPWPQKAVKCDRIGLTEAFSEAAKVFMILTSFIHRLDSGWRRAAMRLLYKQFDAKKNPKKKKHQFNLNLLSVLNEMGVPERTTLVSPGRTSAQWQRPSSPTSN